MGHFYAEKDGKIVTRHKVPNASKPGKMRDSRVTDARKAALDGEIWYPSVTTVMDVLGKHSINNWKIDQHLEMAYTIPRDDLTYDIWSKRVKIKTQAKMDEAPEAGTSIHDVLEAYLGKGVIPDDPIEIKICENVKQALYDNCGNENWECEKSFVSSKHGFGGCADLVSDNWIVDYKSKQTKAKFKPGKMVYKEHRMQLAAYSEALHDETVWCANIFVCLETGEVDFHPHEDYLLMRKEWETFRSCLDIYHLNSFNPKEYP